MFIVYLCLLINIYKLIDLTHVKIYYHKLPIKITTTITHATKVKKVETVAFNPQSLHFP